MPGKETHNPLLFMLVKSRLDLSVNAERPVCKGSNHSGIMGDEVEGQGLEANTVCIVFLCAGMMVFLSGEGVLHGSSSV